MNRIKIYGQSTSFQFYEIETDLYREITIGEKSISEIKDEGLLDDYVPLDYWGLSDDPRIFVNDEIAKINVRKLLSKQLSRTLPTVIGGNGKPLLVNEFICEGLMCEWTSKAKVKVNALTFDIEVFKLPDRSTEFLVCPYFNGMDDITHDTTVISDSWRLYNLRGGMIDLQ